MKTKYLFTFVQEEYPVYTGDSFYSTESAEVPITEYAPVAGSSGTGMGIILLLIIATIALILIVRAVGKASMTKESNNQRQTTSYDGLKESPKYNSFYVADDGTIVRGQKETGGMTSSSVVIKSQNEQEEALSLIKESADAGVAEAQYYLGLCYEQGTVVPKDLDEAKKWYRLSASQSYPQAKFRLGKLLMEDKQ